MTLQSYPSTSEEVVAASGGGSSSASSVSASTSDVYPLPFSLGQKTIAALNNDEQALVSEITDSNFLTPNTNVVIENSSNVDVGNRTVFNRDVTIYQYIQGNNLPEIQNGAVKDEVECNKNVRIFTPEGSRRHKINIKKDTKRRNLYILIAVVTVSSLSLASAVGVLVGSPNSGLTPYPPQPNFISLQTTTPTASSRIFSTPLSDSDGDVFIPKKIWGGVAEKNSTRIFPATLVVIKHTGGPLCTNTTACRARVRQIQNRDMEDCQMPDIRYNFLVGADGKIYIGRGWRVQNEGRSDSLDIAFIGNFSDNRPSRTMLDLGKRIIAKAPWVDDALDYSRYFVVNHNQTENTDSPGEMLFDEVSHWRHYSDDIYFET